MPIVKLYFRLVSALEEHIYSVTSIYPKLLKRTAFESSYYISAALTSKYILRFGPAGNGILARKVR
jgi:hypothetical protein